MTMKARYIVELETFYTNQGVYGDALQAAVNADVERIHANDNSGLTITNLDSISMLFVWKDSPEGHNYWYERSLD